MKQEISITNRQRILEVIAVFFTAAGKFIFMDYLNWRFPFVVGASLFWLIYIIVRYRQQKGILEYWGFRTDNFRKVVKTILPFGLMAVTVFIVIGLVRNTINLTWHIIPILITYPIWGTIQQFLLISLLAGNLKDMNIKGLKDWQIIVIAAVLFSAVHYPEMWLVLGTFILALFYGYVFLGERNLYALGLFHGWLGGLFYYTVMDKDPFLDTFGKLLGIS